MDIGGSMRSFAWTGESLWYSRTAHEWPARLGRVRDENGERGSTAVLANQGRDQYALNAMYGASSSAAIVRNVLTLGGEHVVIQKQLAGIRHRRSAGRQTQRWIRV